MKNSLPRYHYFFLSSGNIRYGLRAKHKIIDVTFLISKNIAAHIGERIFKLDQTGDDAMMESRPSKSLGHPLHFDWDLCSEVYQFRKLTMAECNSPGTVNSMIIKSPITIEHIVRISKKIIW